MINKNNDLPSFVNETNLPKIVDKLTDAKNIKISNNKYGNRVQTVVDKIVEKADDITKAIKQEVVNNSYSFKVGTGNVDVSSDVQDGFGEVGIKGVTYQNCLKFTDDINFNLNLENWNIRAISSDRILVKPNTVYTMIIYVSNVTVSHNELLWVGDVSGNKNSITDEIIRKNVTMGINTFKFTTNSNPEDKAIRFQGSKFVEGVLTFKPLLLEGDHTNNPNLPSYFEDIVGVGDKSKNLFNGKLERGSILANGDNDDRADSLPIRKRSDFIPVKPNTSYFFSANLGEKNTNWRFYDVNKNFISSYSYGNCCITPNNCSYLRFANGHDSSLTLSDFVIQIEEGTVATPYQKHWEGYKIEILSCGKNLYNIHNDITLTYGISKIEEGTITTKTLDSYGTFGLVNSLHNVNSRIFNKPTKIVKGKKYSISCKARKISGEGNLNYFAIFGFKKDKNSYMNTGISHSNLQNINLSTDWLELKYSNVATDDFDTVCPCFQVLNNVNNLILEIKDIQIEEVDASTSYEPYVSDKTQILLDEPLMRLPNGIHDEITRDGKLIRRVGKVILDGSETWSQNSGMSSAEYLVMYTTRIKNINIIRCPKISNYAIIDNYPNNNYSYECMHFEHLSGSKTATALFLRLKVTSANDFVAKIKTNPIIFYYELETPIITELHAPYLRIFKDGHLTFNTLVAPESTHVVQLNKSAQIQNAIKESQSLDNRINVLENNYDNLMLSTISRLNDLELNYTLK